MDLGALVYFILAVAVIGFCLYLIITYIPMPAPIQQAIIVIIVIALLLYFLSFMGVLPRSAVHP